MTGCPQRQTLVSYERGGLSDAQAGPIERHLLACEPCRATMGKIRTGNPDALQLQSTLSAISQDLIHPRTDNAQRPTDVEADNVAQKAHDAGAPPADRWIIPDYERVRLCGEGSYGSVWAVRDRVGVYRALKMIDIERMRKLRLSCKERDALEAYCRKVSRHPYLITVYHVGVAGPYLYYTMELADDLTTRGSAHDNFPGSYQPLTLDKIIRANRLPVDVAIELARRLLRGLAKLHELDLVHRDIKPSNIVFVNRNPKLADIGVLTAEGKSGKPVGTPRYMPPDMMMDKTADTYAFGKVLHEMIAGRDAETFPRLPDECLWGSTRWDPERVSEVLVRACADNAEDRYASAAAMLEELEATATLPFDSLFSELNKPGQNESRASVHAAIQLGFAFVRMLPWILGFIAVMYAIWRFT